MGFLNFTVFAAVLFWIGDLKFRGGENVTGLWYRVSAPLRGESRLLPPIAAVVGWFTAFVLSGYTATIWDGFLIGLIVPLLMFVQMMKMGAPFGWAQGMIDVIKHGFGSVGSGEANDDDFQLPMNVYESEADDVGTWLSDSVPIPRRTLGLIGSSGAGKTNTVKHLLNQIDIRNTRTVVYDHKSDYEELCRDRGIRFTKISGESGSDDVVWNLFREMRDEEDADEIAQALFPDQSGDDSDHFDERARQVFEAVLKYLDRELEDPTNADLARYSQQAGFEKIYEDLGKHEDLESARSALNPENYDHADSVYSTYQRVVSNVFVGSFAEAGDFSIREYMQNPEKYGVLLFSLPRRRRESVAPLFSHLLDRCVIEGMESPEECIYLLDEIEFLPAPMGQLKELVNTGRGENCQAIITLQSVSQLYDKYGKHGAKGIMASLRSVIFLRLGEDESKEYAKDAVGHHYEERTGHVEKSSLPTGGSIETGRETHLQEEPDFRGDFGKFSKGECVVARQGSAYVYGYVPEFVQ